MTHNDLREGDRVVCGDDRLLGTIMDNRKAVIRDVLLDGDSRIYRLRLTRIDEVVLATGHVNAGPFYRSQLLELHPKQAKRLGQR